MVAPSQLCSAFKTRHGERAHSGLGECPRSESSVEVCYPPTRNHTERVAQPQELQSKESEGRRHDAYRVAGTASLGTSRVIVSCAVLYRPLGAGPIGQLTRGGRRPLSAMATRVSMCGNRMLYRSFSMSQGGRMSGGNVEVTAAVAMVDGSTSEDRKDNKVS
jgi:hypothetical protein